jgi:hypothetical protein
LGLTPWKDTKIKFTVDDLELLAVSSAEQFPNIVFGSLDIILDCGVYAVKSAHYEDDSWYLDFYRFIPKKVQAGLASVKRLELRRDRQKKNEEHLAKILEVLRRRDPKRLLNEVSLFRASPEWTEAITREGLEFFSQTQNFAAKNLLLEVLQDQELTQTQRAQLSEYGIQSWQQYMAQGQAVSPVAKTFDELVD